MLQPPARKRLRKDTVSSDEGSEFVSESESAVESLDSDALDDETPPPASQTFRAGKKSRSRTDGGNYARKAIQKADKVSGSKVSPSKKGVSSTKKRKREESSEEDNESDRGEIIGKIVQAPTTGR
ncbi:hypothetical protein FRC17_003650, partial [Serendipita sp. 399]